MDVKLLGVVTSNGMTITGKSNHSIARVIGSVEQRRNGVQVSDVLDIHQSRGMMQLPLMVGRKRIMFLYSIEQK